MKETGMRFKLVFWGLYGSIVSKMMVQLLFFMEFLRAISKKKMIFDK
jgi:hypothetical protein